MSIRRQRLNNDPQMMRYFDPSTGETIRIDAPIFHKEDWVGDDFVDNGTTKWLFSQVSAVGADGTGAIVANGLNGQYALSVASASAELALSRLDFGDNLVLDPSKGLYFETRVALSQAVAQYANSKVLLGLASAHNDTPDSIASNVWFAFAGDANLKFETDDGTTDDDDNSLGPIFVQDEFHVLAFDMTDLGEIKVYVDGVRKPTGSTIFTAKELTAANKLQPYLCVNRASGTTTPDLLVDYVLVAQGGR